MIPQVVLKCNFNKYSTATKLLETNDNLPSPSILFVEDDEDDISIIKEGFEDLQYSSICIYNDALSAIKYLNSIDDEYLPNLIVTDFNLPALNGLQFLKILRNHVRFSEIPVVVLTTSMSANNKKLFFDEGVSKIILKPNAFDEYKDIAGVLKELAEQYRYTQRG
jgi:CheY-like chemotaxis protein